MLGGFGVTGIACVFGGGCLDYPFALTYGVCLRDSLHETNKLTNAGLHMFLLRNNLSFILKERTYR